MSPDAAATPAAGQGPVLGPLLDRWLWHLDGQGFRVGVRERLLVQSLLARLAAAGELPAEVHGMLMLAAPLLCSSREQQRRYAQLLQEFLAPPPAAPARPSRRWARRAADAPPRFGVVIVVMAWALLLALGLWWGARQPQQAALRLDGLDIPNRAGVVADGDAAAPPLAPFYVPPAELPLQPPLPPAWSGPLRVGLLLLGGACAAAALASGVAQRRRRMALSGVRTDEELESHLLHDPAPVDIAPHPVLARAIGRALRQRVAGDAHALDLPATLRATVAAQGAFTPRWRALHRTPEYLVLVDQRHPADHHATAALALVDALARAGVALQVYAFDTTPAAGCWLRGGLGNQDATTRHRVPLATLATRAGGQRLLVFGRAEVLLHPVSGDLQAWAAPLRGLPERAWITPQPVHTWGAAEQAADEAGFLVLPLQEAALETLAGWFTSRRLSLALDADTPLAVPALLRGDGLEWVTRTDPPPPETLQALLQQLRGMLGGPRFQWLCGCAIFPAMTPALTLALGRHVMPDARRLALGLATLSALPWFRWGHMPDWLRRALLQELAPDRREQFAAEVRERLDGALDAGSGPLLADVATRKRRRLGALQQQRGPLRDVVLADFVREDTDPGLATRLPEALRRQLFRNGNPDAGWRPAVLACGAVFVVAALLAATPLWPVLVGTTPQPALALQREGSSSSLPPQMPAGPVQLASLGESRVRVAGPGVAAVFDLGGGSTAPANALPASIGNIDSVLLQAMMRPLSDERADGVRVVVLNGRVELRSADGKRLGAPLDPGPGAPRAFSAAFTPSGSRVLAWMEGRRLFSWGTPWPDGMVAVVACEGSDPTGGLAAALARTLADWGRSGGASSSSAWAADATSFSPAAWTILQSQAAFSPLAPGELLRTADLPEEAALAARGVLQQFVTRLIAPSWRAPQLTAGGGRTLVVGACTSQPIDDTPPAEAEASIPGVDRASAQALARRVRAMFADDAQTRMDATAALVRDNDWLSDAVGLAVAAAGRAQALRQPVQEPELSGIYNTLVLLQSASPTTLFRNRAEIQRLLQAAQGNGDKTTKQVQAVRQRLAAAQKRIELVKLQITSEAQRALAERLVGEMSAAGLNPGGIELVGGRAPAVTEIGARGFSDRRTARLLRDGARKEFGDARLVSLPGSVDTDTYEIRLATNLCVTRTVDGCTPAASAAQTSNANAAPPPASPAPATNAGSTAGQPASDRLLDLVTRFEGVTDGDPSTPNLDPYLDPLGIWTIGYGHPLTENGTVLRGAENQAQARSQYPGGITLEQARTLLRGDLASALANVDQLVKVPLAASQREALAAFVWNVGAASLAGSTLLKLVNAGDFDAAADQFVVWSKGRRNGVLVELPGLRQRREAERDLWNEARPARPAPKQASKKSAS